MLILISHTSENSGCVASALYYPVSCAKLNKDVISQLKALLHSAAHGEQLPCIYKGMPRLLCPVECSVTIFAPAIPQASAGFQSISIQIYTRKQMMYNQAEAVPCITASILH